MSASQVLATIRGALTDETTGLAAKAATFIAADNALNRVRTDYRLIRWSLADRMHTTTQPNVAVSLRRWLSEQKLATFPSRDGMLSMEIAYECFEADQGLIEDNVATTAIALLNVLDGLREYSDANGGTIVEIFAQAGQPSIDIQFGDFAGPVNSFGFVCRFTVLERSAI